MADVVVGLVHTDVELGVRRDVEALARHGLLPFIAAVQLVLAGTAHAFHDLGGGRTKGQRGRQHHTDGLLGAVGQGEAVAHAFAVKVDIGLGGQGDAGELVGAHGVMREVRQRWSKPTILGQRGAGRARRGAQEKAPAGKQGLDGA